MGFRKICVAKDLETRRVWDGAGEERKRDFAVWADRSTEQGVPEKHHWKFVGMEHSPGHKVIGHVKQWGL
jgi:hypothetical protein